MSCNNVSASAVASVTGVMSVWGVASCVLLIIVAVPGTTISACGFGLSLSTLSGLKGISGLAWSASRRQLVAFQPSFPLKRPYPDLYLHFTAVHIVISINYLERPLRSRAMADESRSKVISANPISKGLDPFRDSFEFKCRGLEITGADALYHISGEGPKNSLLDLISALQVLPASRSLPSKGNNVNLFADLLELNSAVNSGNFDIERIIPLLRAVLDNEPDQVIWSNVYAAVAASTAFTAANPTTPPLSAPSPAASFQQTPWLHNTGSFANSTEHRKYVDGVLKEELGQLYVGVPGLKSAAHAVFDKCKEGDNPLYQEESGWQGWPEGARERDQPLAQPHQPVQGSTADRNAGVDSKCRWSQILILGELKSNLLADKASKAWLNLGQYTREEFNQLGGIASKQFNINKDRLQFVSAVLRFLDKQYIKIKRDNHTKRLVINEVVKRQFLERNKEGELLRKATKKDVVNVARYYYHETVCVGGQNNNICENARHGLDITKAKNYRPESWMPPPSTAGRRIGQSSSVARRKRSSSSTSALLLTALEGCIDGYELLYTQASMLQCNISPNNLIPAFLINLNLAIKEQREKSLGAQGKTSTQAFIAIRVLLDNKLHSFMHDLELFFWNYVDTEELAKIKKGVVGDERDFLKTIEATFTLYYQPLIPHVNRLRRKVFPDGRRWRIPNPKLYDEMKEILRTARVELNEVEG
ncbi:hypothetical protein K505DRAFT_410741 [Melanomma pulvis-pyrius CBS 109.77]|uniref:Fungal-type protein kinase domain-containing protein n=1 Tax=Melanomma pulvis-pyrius CBS 109.77 TaxID=1314802 RepID=A0A6A6WX62_9PLEO|nr:hypothetical protein K505DRAFT_410741 [Melanomma pulvis-pyrius CBS 109.77]